MKRSRRLLLFGNNTGSPARSPYLVFSTQPGGANSGSAFSPQPVVTAKNPDGTTKTSFTGNVTLAVNTVSGSHSLGGTVTVAAVAGVATFSGVTDTGSGDATLTATSPGLAGATSASFTTAAASAQFTENWSSNSIRSTLWTTALSGSGAASAATGALVLSDTSAGGSVDVTNPGSSSNRYDLTTAGALANGVVADMQNLSGARVYFAIQDATGLGWAFQFNGPAHLHYGTLSAGAGSIDTRWVLVSADIAYDAVAHRYLRIMKSGSNVAFATSPDASTWTTQGTLAIGAQTLTAMGIGFALASGSTTTTGKNVSVTFY